MRRVSDGQRRKAALPASARPTRRTNEVLRSIYFPDRPSRDTKHHAEIRSESHHAVQRSAVPRSLLGCGATPAFDAVEFLFPYAFPAAELTRAACSDNGLSWCCSTCRPATGTRANAASPACRSARRVPRRHRRRRSSMRRAGRAAAELPGRQGAGRCRRRTTARATLVDNLRFAAGELQARGMTLLIEPINTCDIPGFSSTARAQALDVIDGSAPTTCSCSTTSTTCSAWKATGGDHRRSTCRDRPHPARRQPGPPRTGHRRDQLPVPVRHIDYSATAAGSAASTAGGDHEPARLAAAR